MSERQDLKLDLDEGNEIEIVGDLNAADEPVAVVHVAALFDTLGEGIELPGISLKIADERYLVRANVQLTAEQARQVADALLYAVRPLTDSERSRIGTANSQEPA